MHNHRFLLLRKRKAADKTFEQCLLKEFKATGKNSGESESEMHLQSICTSCMTGISKNEVNIQIPL